MSQFDAQIHSLLRHFFGTWLFNSLSPVVRKQVASKLQISSFQPGQFICPPNELPSSVHYLVQGRARILGTMSHQSPTLAVVGKGAIVGWDSLLRRVPGGSVRAAIPAANEEAEVITLSLPADEFETLALKHLMPTLARATLPELFDTLACFLATMPARFAEVNLKDIVQYIEQEQLATVRLWQPNRSTGLELSHDSEQIWLISGGASLNVPIGTPVTQLNVLHSVRPSLFPVRLLGIERSFLASALLSGSTALEESAVSARLLTSAFELPSPPPAAIATLPLDREAVRSQYPVRRSPVPDRLEDIVACFSMICDFLQVPHRPDALRRWLKQRSIDDLDPADLCVRIAQAVGLSAQVVQFTPTAGGLNRLTVPAVVECHSVFTVLYEVSPKSTVLGSPRTGLLRLSPDQLSQRLTNYQPDSSTATAQAIVFERLPATPTQRFGFKWFVPLLKNHWGVLTQVLIASVFVQILGLANPLLVQQVIDKVIINSNIGVVPMFGALLILFASLEGILTILRMYLFASTTTRLDLRLSVEIVRHLLHLPLNFFEKRPVGELSSRLSELENVRQFLTGTALTAILDVLFSVMYIAVMFLYSDRLTFCVLLSVPIIVISTLLVSALQKKLIRTKSDRGAKVQSYLVEVLSGIFTVKAQHMENLVEATWRDRYVGYLGSSFTTSTVSTIFGSFNQFLNTVSSFLVLWVGASLVIEGQLSLGGLIAFRILAGYVTGPMIRLAHLWQKFQETSLSMELLADIANAPIEEPPDNADLDLPRIEGKVEYSEVCFGFQAGQQQLASVSLTVPQGAFVGVVGQSGSGKSTLMKLLPRLYVPRSGQIYIDGYDVNKVKLDSLRRQIGYVPQDAVLFEGTIRDNIALFGEMEDDAIIAAAKIAEAHEFIMQLPQGYSTRIAERGGSLSGGQRQRVAIARVVASNPRLLVFDEATSALDYDTERRVCDNLMRYFADRTVFFITHRLTTLTRADWILFMASGIIAEQGTHADLMAKRQLYYCLYNQQSRL